MEVHKRLHQYRQKCQTALKNVYNYKRQQDEVAACSHINAAVYDNLNTSRKINHSLMERLSHGTPSPSPNQGNKQRSVFGDISNNSSAKKVR